MLSWIFSQTSKQSRINHQETAIKYQRSFRPIRFIKITMSKSLMNHLSAETTSTVKAKSNSSNISIVNDDNYLTTVRTPKLQC